MEVIKEKHISGSLEPVSIKSTETILYQMKKCVCEIYIQGTGYFTKIPYNNDLLSVLITNNHVLGEEEIKDGKTISISLNNEEEYKNIKIDSSRKRYTNKNLDVTIIEIKENIDNINDFLLLDNQILEKYKLGPNEDNINSFNDTYEDQSIYLLNYKEGKEIVASYGLLHSITDCRINHKCNKDTGSSGAPILLLKSNKVIGVHYGSGKFAFNFGTFILKPIFEFQQIYDYRKVIKKNNDSINSENINYINKISPMKNHDESNILVGKQSQAKIIQLNNLKNNLWENNFNNINYNQISANINLNQTKRNTQIINKPKDEIGKKYIKKKNNDLLYTNIEPRKIKIDDSNKNNRCILIKKKFNIRKPETKIAHYFSNLKYRDKAAKIIQAWWRKKKNIYYYRLKQIIKIQSVFRGRYIRKNMYDLLYLNYLNICFCRKIEIALKNHLRPYVWKKLFGKS